MLEEEQEEQMDEEDILRESFDSLETEEDIGYTEEEYRRMEIANGEKEMLEKIPLPGSSSDEKRETAKLAETSRKRASGNPKDARNLWTLC